MTDNRSYSEITRERAAASDEIDARLAFLVRFAAVAFWNIKTAADTYPETLALDLRGLRQFLSNELLPHSGLCKDLGHYMRYNEAPDFTSPAPPAPEPIEREFSAGQRVRKRSGSSWQGTVVGFYRTALTPDGYCVESEREPGSVQIYPGAALEAVDE